MTIVIANTIMWLCLWVFTGGALYNTIGTHDWVALTIGILGMPVIMCLLLWAILSEAENAQTTQP